MNTLARLLKVHEDERELVLRITLVFTVIQSTHAFGANSSDALFFLRFGVEFLPRMILISGFAVMAALILHAVGLTRWEAKSWLPRATAVGGAMAMAEWALTYSNSAAVYPTIWIVTQVLIMASYIIMWNTAAASSSTRQAKRLYPLFAAAGVAGAIVGNLTTGPIASLLGTESLLALQGGGLLIGAVLIKRAVRFFHDDGDQQRTPVIRDLFWTARLVSSQRLLRLTAILVAVLSSLFFLVVFPFNEAVAAAFETEADVARYLGLLASAATALTFVVSLMLTSRLLAAVGIVGSLMIAPITYAAGFGLWLGALTLTTATLVRAMQWVATNAIGGTATQAVYNVLPGARRGQVMSFMTAVPYQLGIVAGGALLMISADSGHTPTFLTGLALALVALFVVWRMRSAYLESVVAAVRRGLTGVLSTPHEGLVSPLGREATDALISHLDGPTSADRLVALSGLVGVDAPLDDDRIEPLLSDPDPRVRIAAFDFITTSNPSRLDELIGRLAADSSAEVRRHAIQAMSRGNSAAAALLTDEDCGVRAEAAGIVGGTIGQQSIDDLISDGSSESIVAALEVVAKSDDLQLDAAQLLAHRDADVRRGVVVHGTGLAPAQLADLLDDVSVAVRRSAAARLASTPEGRELLYRSLDTGSVSATEAALRALTPVSRFREDFLDWAHHEATRARYLAELGEALTDRSTPVVEYLAQVIDSRCRRLTDWVLLAMTTEDTKGLMEVVERGITSEDPETRAQALEALDAGGDHAITRPLLALLESDSSQRPSMIQTEALVELASDFDPWLSRLASMAIADPGLDGLDVSDSSIISETTLKTIERMVALEQVPMFSDLDPEDLSLLAEATEEIHYAPGEPIYTTGEPGNEMLVIVDGEALISADSGGGRHEVARYGPGQHIGELAVLRSSTRSADVRAGQTGLSGLVISDTDLRSVLQERPDVAIALLTTLAGRLADQT